MAALFAGEVIEAVRYAVEKTPYSPPYAGFISDAGIRQLGVPLVSGAIPGVAVVVGKAKDVETAGAIARELQAKSLLALYAGPVAKQVKESGVKIGPEFYTIPLGENITAAIHAVNLAIRVPMIFGGIKPGQKDEILKYMAERVPAFVVALGELDPLIVAVGAGVIAAGLPVIIEQEYITVKEEKAVTPEAKVPVITGRQKIPEIPGKLIPQPDVSKIISTGCEVRGIKVVELKLDIPVGYSPAFVGERVRRADMYVEFDARKNPCFEVCIMKPLDQIEDGKIELIGPDIKDMEEGKAYPVGFVVYVAGKKMEDIYSPVIERRFHEYMNYAEGVMHIGSRDIIWVRISKEAAKKGLSLKHIAKALYTMVHKDFGKIVDKVEVRVITDPEKIKPYLEEARAEYRKRDERIAGLTDEQVEDYYTCTLCQSFAPDHVCIITPERYSACGAISWLDAKAAYKLDPTGPQQMVKKGKCLNPEVGEYEGVNEIVFKLSHQTVKRLFLYSITRYPMTACGCFECVAFVIPEVNGVGVVNREFKGETPLGMAFSTLAGMIGGGKQTPGFMGIAKKYIVSRKFLVADGGLKRLVWMPKMLKEELKEELKKRCEEEGVPDLFDKIADETVAKTVDELMEWLKKVKHPVLEMPPLPM